MSTNEHHKCGSFFLCTVFIVARFKVQCWLLKVEYALFLLLLLCIDLRCHFFTLPWTLVSSSNNNLLVLWFLLLGDVVHTKWAGNGEFFVLAWKKQKKTKDSLEKMSPCYRNKSLHCIVWCSYRFAIWFGWLPSKDRISVFLFDRSKYQIRFVHWSYVTFYARPKINGQMKSIARSRRDSWW